MTDLDPALMVGKLIARHRQQAARQAAEICALIEEIARLETYIAQIQPPEPPADAWGDPPETA